MRLNMIKFNLMWPNVTSTSHKLRHVRHPTWTCPTSPSHIPSRKLPPPQKSHCWKSHGKIQHFQLPSGPFIFPSSHFPGFDNNAKSSRQVRRIQTNSHFFSKKRLSWRGELDHEQGQDVDICKCERLIIGETFPLWHSVRRGRLGFTQTWGWIIRYVFSSWFILQY